MSKITVNHKILKSPEQIKARRYKHFEEVIQDFTTKLQGVDGGIAKIRIILYAKKNLYYES